MIQKAVSLVISVQMLLLAGCSQPVNVTPVGHPLQAAQPQDSPLATPTLQPQASPTIPVLQPTPTATPTATPTPVMVICSPLEDILLEELRQPDLMKNPFEMPRPGLDDGHPGVDFAYWSRGERTAMLGLGVQAVLGGRVAGLIQNRPPYGYAVIIETPLDSLSPAWIDRLQAPPLVPTIQPAPNLTCPADTTGKVLPERQSLYLLYAHLNLPPELVIGQDVACGQQIGEVGTTGRSVNPHLHLETRVGPAGVLFTEMAHYDNGATENEMRSYCTWRVSGLFQPLDPLAVIQALSLQP